VICSNADKRYVATVQLGVTTDTADAEGSVLEPVRWKLAGRRRGGAGPFVGEIDQVPPMYSALKRDGKPLYEYARAGIELERAPRRVRVRLYGPDGGFLGVGRRDGAGQLAPLRLVMSVIEK
jgi:tRNA pseudouridine(55) synthase